MKSNTKIKGISINQSGIVYNTISEKQLTISQRGYFTFNGKVYNLPKLLLETFKNIPVRNGRIIFKDGNKTNFNIDNLDYQTKLAELEQPKNEDIINVINYYFAHDPIKNLNNVFKYRTHLSTVLAIRDFFKVYQNESNLNIFKDYSDIFTPGYYNLSKIHKITVLEAKRTIFYFLNKLIDDCKKDGSIIIEKDKKLCKKPR